MPHMGQETEERGVKSQMVLDGCVVKRIISRDDSEFRNKNGQ
jgi:hypothetical protein